MRAFAAAAVLLVLLSGCLPTTTVPLIAPADCQSLDCGQTTTTNPPDCQITDCQTTNPPDCQITDCQTTNPPDCQITDCQTTNP